MKKIIALWLIVMFLGMNFYIAEVYAQGTRVVPRQNPVVVPRQTPTVIPRQGVIDTRIPGVSQGILDRYDDSFTGEALTVYADSYEPTVLNTALIEQGNIPVYVFLKANTLGGLLGQDQSNFEPLYGKPKIRYVQTIKTEPNQFVVSKVWLPPMQLQSLPLQLDVPRPSFDVENMGTLVLTLRQIPREADVPDVINLNITVRSYFDTERTLSYGREQLVLDEVKNENEFKGRKGYTSPLFSTTYPFMFSQPINTALQNYLEDTFRTRGAVQAESFANPATANADDCFFAGQGCIQAVSIGSTEASFQVYNGHLIKVGGLVKLRVGQESPPMLWQGASSYLSGSQLKLRLDQIVDPKAKRVKLIISDGVKTETKWFYEGDLLSEDSIWRIKSIESKTENNKVVQKLVLGLRERSEIAEVIRRYPTPVESIWKTITFDLTKPLSELAQDIFGGQTLTLEKTYNLGDNQIDPDTLQDPCSFKDKVDISIKGKVTSYCNAIDEFRNIIKESSGIKDENNDLWNDRAYCKIGKTYRELAGTLTDDTQKKSARAIAIESYELVQDQQVCFKEDGEILGTILSDLKFDLFRNVNYQGPRVKEVGKELFVKIEDVQGGKVEGGSGIEVLVDGQVKNLDLGSEVTDGAVISKVNDNNIEISLTRDDLYEYYGRNIRSNIEGKEIVFELYVTKIDKDQISLFKNLNENVDLKLNELKEISGLRTTSGENNYNGKFKLKAIENGKARIEIVSLSKDGTVIFDNSRLGNLGKITLNVGRAQVINGKQVLLNKIDFKRQAVLTVIPFSAAAYSDSSFTIRIPVEKRPIKLTPELIESQIQKTEEIIAKLDNIIKRFEAFVTAWRKFCIVTFGVLSVKNIFTGVAGSRTAVMRGIDGKSGWDQYCEQNSGASKKYSTFDKCIFDNEGIINKQIKTFDEKKDAFNENLKAGDGNVLETKEYVKWQGDDYKFVPKNIEKKEVDKVLSQDEIEELIYLESVKESAPDCWIGESEKCPSIITNGFKRYGELTSDLKKKTTAFEQAKEAIASKTSTGLSDKDKQDAFDTVYQNLRQEGKFTDFNKAELEEINKRYKIGNQDIDAIKENQIHGVYVTGGKVHGYVIGKEPNGAIQSVSKVDNLIRVKCTDLTQKIEGQVYKKVEDCKNVNGEFSIGGKYAYKDKNNVIYFVEREIATGEVNNKFAEQAVAEYYPDGKPYCVPYKDGHYIKVEGYKKTGSVDENELSLWNVGNNGLIDCGSKNSDDQFIFSGGFLNSFQDTEFLGKRISTAALLRDMINTVNKNVNRKDFYYDANNKKYKISSQAADYLVTSQFKRCTDFMGILDCKILFNVCDPVMCPASRFNLGGRWQVKDVVRTGVIGSLILGWPNFGVDQPVPPICMTGILAGLKNIRSILQGYGSCLNEAKVSGKSVGICDRIRSIFICEMLWREALAILDVNQGLLSWIIGKGKDKLEGGGEYIEFKSSLDNLGDSVNFFTQEYANNAFSAYKSRSLGEFGSEICKAAIYSKVPGLGDFFDQLAKPSDPPQFTATFSEFPYSETFGNSRYSVYYHIYAGRDPSYYGGLQGGLNYAVFLRNSRTGAVLYVTNPNQCGSAARKFIGFEGFADENIDCTQRTGFNEVCIEINGYTECGFGKVSSDFGLNYLEDFVVKNELTKKITNERECVSQPGIGTGLRDTSLGGSLTGVYTDYVSSAPKGIARICSVIDPNIGTSERNWEVVGVCGKDKNGNNLGSCWVDKRTFNVRDLERRQGLEEFFKNNTELFLGLNKIDPNLLLRDQQEIKKVLDDAKSNYENSKSSYLNGGDAGPLTSLIEYYKGLLNKLVYSPQSRAEIYYMIGKIYLDLAKGRRDLSGLKIDSRLFGLPEVQPPSASETSTSQSSGTTDETQTKSTGKNLPNDFSISINNLDNYANNNEVKITVKGTNIDKVTFSLHSDFNNGQTLPYKSEYKYTLPNKQGIINIYARAISNYGGIAETSDSIRLDSIPPKITIYNSNPNLWKPGYLMLISCDDGDGTGCVPNSFGFIRDPRLNDCKASNFDNFEVNNYVTTSPITVCATMKDSAGNIAVTQPVILTDNFLDSELPSINVIDIEERRSFIIGIRYFLKFEAIDNVKLKQIKIIMNDQTLKILDETNKNEYQESQDQNGYKISYEGEIKPLTTNNKINIQIVATDLAGNIGSYLKDLN